MISVNLPDRKGRTRDGTYTCVMDLRTISKRVCPESPRRDEAPKSIRRPQTNTWDQHQEPTSLHGGVLPEYNFWDRSIHSRLVTIVY